MTLLNRPQISNNSDENIEKFNAVSIFGDAVGWSAQSKKEYRPGISEWITTLFGRLVYPDLHNVMFVYSCPSKLKCINRNNKTGGHTAE